MIATPQPSCLQATEITQFIFGQPLSHRASLPLGRSFWVSGYPDKAALAHVDEARAAPFADDEAVYDREGVMYSGHAVSGDAS
jgi:hypothetical protein